MYFEPIQNGDLQLIFLHFDQKTKKGKVWLLEWQKKISLYWSFNEQLVHSLKRFYLQTIPHTCYHLAKQKSVTYRHAAICPRKKTLIHGVIKNFLRIFRYVIHIIDHPKLTKGVSKKHTIATEYSPPFPSFWLIYEGAIGQQR